MAILKKSNKLLAPVLVATILAILALTGLILLSKEQPKQASIVSEPSTLTEEMVDKDEKGVYTNYKYNFKFEYPESIYLKGDDTATRPLITRITWNSNSDKYLNFTLSVLDAESDDSEYPNFERSLYFEAVEKQTGESISYYSAKNGSFMRIGSKIMDITTDNLKGVLYRYNEPKTAPYKGAEVYSADFLSEGRIITIRTSSFDSEDLRAFLAGFKEIAGSLTLLK